MNTKPPLSCSIVLLTKCILKCRMCHMWKSGKGAGELDIDKWKDFILSLSDFFDGRGEIVLSGGEPLLKDGVLDLISFCKSKGLKTIMTSNAFLIDEDTAKRISDSGLDQISISLDSFIEETHDSLRGVKGSYKRVIDAIGYLKKYSGSPRVEIITVISGENLKEIPGHVEWVRRNGKIDSLYFQAIACPFFSSAGKNWHKEGEFSSLWPRDYLAVSRTIDNLIELKERNGLISNSASQLRLFKSYFENPDKRVGVKRCRLGDFVVNIDQAGNVFLCCFDKPLGNIKKDKIKDLWYSPQAKDLRIKMHNCNAACNNIVNCFFKEG